MPSSHTTRETIADGQSWLATGLVATFAFVFSLGKIRNFDVWWHLRTGEWILENGAVPKADPFSFTAQGTEWIAHYWLSDVLFTLVHRATGANGLIVLTALVLATAFALLHRIMVRRGVHPFFAALLLGLAVVAARFRFMVRPHVFMFLFSAAFLSVLWGDLEKRPGRLLWLLPVMLLWVNMHGSFFLALVFVGALWVEKSVAWWRHPDSGSRLPATWLLGTLGALAVLVFASPYGLALPMWVVGDFTSHAVTRSFELVEHQALPWGSYPLVWGLLIATLASFIVGRRNTRVSDGLITVALLVLALRSVRLAALASGVFAIVIGANLWPWLSQAIEGRRKLRTKEGPRARWLRPVVSTFALAALGAWAFTSTYTPEKVYRFGLGVMESRFPIDAVDFLEELDVQGAVLNSWEFGGYLLWRLPGVKTFADGRTLEAHMDAVDETRSLNMAGLVAYAERYDIRVIMVKPDDEPAASFAASSPLFRAVFFDDRAGVYLRQDLYASLAAEGRIEDFRWIRPDSRDESYLVELAEGGHASEVEEELRRAVSLSPQSFQPRFMLAVFLEASGRPEALDAFESAIEANPALAFTHYGLGLRGARFAVGIGEWSRAAEIVEASLPYGATGESYFLLGTAWQMTERLPEAEEAFKRVLDGDPANHGSLVNLGFVYLDTDRPAEAVRAFETAAGIAPGDENTVYGLALAHQRNGSPAEAERIWQIFLERFPNSRWTANARRFLQELGEGVG